MYMHILIATDGSELAGKGVDHGFSLAKAVGAKVTVVTVTEPIPALAGRTWSFSLAETERYDAEQRQFASDLFAPIKADAARLGVVYEVAHVSNNLPAEAILKEAAARGCSLIVMASNGRRGIGRLVLGSQTHEVVSRSSIPVLVVR